MFLDRLEFLLGHWLVGEGHQAQEFYAAFVSGLSAYFCPKRALVESLELPDVLV
mgnify:CR=1 FL=1